MDSKGLGGALAGGLLGALIWAGIAYSIELEIGWVAWGIGLLVGGGWRLLAGVGSPSAGASCAAIALGSIIVGKCFALSWLIDQGVAKGIYDHLRGQSVAFAEVRSKRQYPEFMVAHGFSPSPSPEHVSRDDLERFEELWAPQLKDFGREPPAFDEWAASPKGQTCLARANEEMQKAEISTVGLVFSSLSPVDLIFALLGIATAYKAATAGSPAQSPPAV